MADKEAVLASLNINAMTFNKVTFIPITITIIFTITIHQHDNVPVDFGPAGSSVRAGEVYGSKVRMVLTEVFNKYLIFNTYKYHETNCFILSPFAPYDYDRL